jgi:glycosyltransferase involved in cell wall biosynthesis
VRIAQVAPLAEAVPPRLYGGTERVVSWLTEALVHAGHDVTLFASGDSLTTATLSPIVPQALRLAGVCDHVPATLLMLDEVRKCADEFDIIHFHVDMLQYPLFESLAARCVTTLHGRLDLPHMHGVYSRFPTMPLVSISDAQRGPMPAGLNWLATIHHGLPANLHAPGAGGGGYLLFLGRIAPEKRPDRAIEIAKRACLPLKIAAKVDPADQRYFHEHIEPLLADPLIEFVGEVNDAQKQVLLGDALALVFPIDWPEPFGLVMIEAMAAGTPVIAWPQGSVPEVLEPGVTGALVRTLEDAADAARTIASFDRRRIRHEFERRFTADVMAKRYVAAYDRLLAARPALLPAHLSAGALSQIQEAGYRSEADGCESAR